MAAKQGYGPDLRKYLNLRMELRLNGSRKIVGTLKGYDQMMNLVIDNAVEIVSPDSQNDIGTVFIRGNSVVMWECLDKVVSNN